MERSADEIGELDDEDAEGQAQLQLRRPEQEQLRRQPAVGGGVRGDAEGGGGDVVGGEEVLQLCRQLLRRGPPLRGVHAGGVEEDDGGGLRAGGVSPRSVDFDDLLLQSAGKYRRRETLLVSL